MTRETKRVLVISGAFPPTRVAEADEAFLTCQKLVGRGFEVDALTGRGSVADTSTPFRVHPIMATWSWRETLHVLRILRQVDPSFVFLLFAGHLYNFHPMVTVLPTVIRRVCPNARVVSQFTYPIGSRPWQHSMAARLIWKMIQRLRPPGGISYTYGTLLSDSDRVVVMATSHMHELGREQPGLPAKAILIPPPPLMRMSPPGLPTRLRGRQQLGLAETDFVYAFFGRLRQGKGLETLLEAFQRLCTRHTNAKLAIIGGADEDWFGHGWNPDSLRELAVKLGIEDKVVWTGEYAWDSDLGSAYLRAVDVAVLAFQDGVDLNNSSFAAVAAHGLPTITTRGKTLEEVFEDGSNVLLCAPGDPAATAAAMERLLVDAELRARLSAGIERLANAWFSWDVSIERMIEAFNAPRVGDDASLR